MTALSSRTWLAALILALVAAGCVQSTSRTSQVASYDPQRAFVTLDKIDPPVRLPDAAGPAEAAAAIPASARRFFRSGQQHFDEELWGDAINDLARAIQVAPQFVDARLLMARASLLQGNSTLARTQLEEAAKVRPRDAAVHQLLGDVAWQAHDTPAAIIHYRRALLCPNAAPHRSETILAHLFLGLSLREQRYLSAAQNELRAYERAMEAAGGESRESPELRQVGAIYGTRVAIEIGQIHETLGQWSEAAAAYRRALTKMPDDRDLSVHLVRALANSGHQAEAIETARKLCLADDGSGPGLGLLIEASESTKQRGRVELELRRLGDQTHSAGLLLKLAAKLNERKNTRDATALLHRAVELQPARADAHLQLADAFARSDDADGFLGELAAAIRVRRDSYESVDMRLVHAMTNPGARPKLLDAAKRLSQAAQKPDATALLLYGRALAIDDRVDESARVLGDAIDADPSLGPAHAALAGLKLARHLWSSALESCDRAISAGIREATIYHCKAVAHEALDDNRSAESAYQQAVQINSRDAASLMGLARLYDRTGRSEMAIQMLREVADKADPANSEAREALIRAYLTMPDHQGDARKQYETLVARGGPPALVARVSALVKLATDASMPGAERLERYRSELQKVVEQYRGETESLMDLALSYVATHDYSQALKWVERLLSRDPEQARALELRVTMLAKLLRFSEAQKQITSMLAQRPKYSAWSVQRAEMAMDSGDFSLAAQVYRDLIKRTDLAPQRPAWQGALIEALDRGGDRKAAVAEARKWLDEAPDEIRRRSVYLRQLERDGRRDEAVTQATGWLNSDPDRNDLRTLLIGQLEAADRHVEAEQRAVRWLSEKPGDEDLQRIFLSTLLGAGRWDGVLDYLGSVKAGGKSPSFSDALRVQTHLLARRYDKAADELHRLMRATGEEELTFNPLRLLIATRQYEDAEALCLRMIAPHAQRMKAKVAFNERELIDLYQQLATIYQYSGRMQRCFETLEQALEIAPDDVGINNDLGYLWADSGVHLDRAERMTRFAVGERPRLNAYLDSLGWVLYKQGRFEESEHFLKLARTQSESPDPVIVEHFGDLQFQRGQHEEAGRCWAEAATAASQKDRIVTPQDEEVTARCRRKEEQLRHGRKVEVSPVVGRTAVESRK